MIAVPGFAESTVEVEALEWLRAVGYAIEPGGAIAPGGAKSGRLSYNDVLLSRRLRTAVSRLNPRVPPEAREDAIRKVLDPEMPSLTNNNRVFQSALVHGVPVEYRASDGHIAGERVRLLDSDDPTTNEWLAVNQFTVAGNPSRRPDIVLFCNGLPLAVIELKDPTDPKATIHGAYNQLQTYKQDIPSLFVYNGVLVVSDGLEARIGSLTADWEHFMPWKTIDGVKLAPSNMPQLKVLTLGALAPERLLELIRSFTVFEDDGKTIEKKIAAYHQYHAVKRAVRETVRASAAGGDRRVGVVWHTQGAGKSLSMVFYAGQIVEHPAMENPTLVVLTDRTDLDGQLFGTFSRCHDALRQTPVQAESRRDLRQLLHVASGGVVFTTIQKFVPDKQGDTVPQVSDRRNIVVIADEAHRSQYDFIDGYAHHLRAALPHASFIGFTGTPIETADKDTRRVFGDYIDVYDMLQAVEDGATVRIYYEARYAKLDLDEKEKPHLDPEFEEVTEAEEESRRERLKTKWAQLEALVGSDKRIAEIAADLVSHFEARREANHGGKAMVVAMSRRIAVALYDAIIRLRPDWHDSDDSKGVIKVIMTGSAMDQPQWQQHIRNKPRREALRERFKKPDDPFQVVIVRDMWLTGFDAPCLYTMYVDKPMHGHNLMQAIARVNRVFHDKPGGLIVDYLGLADQLKRALADYTEGGGKGKPTIDQGEAVAAMLERYEICRDMFHGFDYASALRNGQLGSELLAAAVDYVIGLEKTERESRQRFKTAVHQLSQAFSLAVPHPEAIRIRPEVQFFQAVRAALLKLEGTRQTPEEDLDQAIAQIVSKAIVTGGVIDIFAGKGLEKPDISILSDEFLAEVRGLPHRNLAAELLKRLLSDEIKAKSRTHLVRSRSFAEMLEQAVRAYQNRAITMAEFIAALVDLAKRLREERSRGAQLGLSDAEVAFYDALEVNDSAVKVLGDETLKTIARELLKTVKANTSIDWTHKASVQANLRRMIRRVLRQYGYPPDKAESATLTVFKQAAMLEEALAPVQVDPATP